MNFVEVRKKENLDMINVGNNVLASNNILRRGISELWSEDKTAGAAPHVCTQEYPTHFSGGSMSTSATPRLRSVSLPQSSIQGFVERGV